MSTPVQKPAQIPTELSQPFWEGAKQGKLLLQRCGACGVLRHYPRLLCSACYSEEVESVQASGKGVIHSWTVAHHPYHPAFVNEVPYTLVTVDLDEGTRALGRWRGETPKIGLKVAGVFEVRDDGVDLVFAPAVSASAVTTPA